MTGYLLINLAALIVALKAYAFVHFVMMRKGLPGFFALIVHGALLLIQITVMVVLLFHWRQTITLWHWLWLPFAMGIPVALLVRRGD